MAYLDESGLSRLWTHIMTKLGGKVDKEDGKGLSSNDFTTAEKEKLARLKNITVDSSINSYSTNPVQNKVIYNEFQKVKKQITDPKDEICLRDFYSDTYEIRINGYDGNLTSRKMFSGVIAQNIPSTFEVGDTFCAENLGIIVQGTFKHGENVDISNDCRFQIWNGNFDNISHLLWPYDEYVFEQPSSSGIDYTIRVSDSYGDVREFYNITVTEPLTGMFASGHVYDYTASISDILTVPESQLPESIVMKIREEENYEGEVYVNEEEILLEYTNEKTPNGWYNAPGDFILYFEEGEPILSRDYGTYSPYIELYVYESGASWTKEIELIDEDGSGVLRYDFEDDRPYMFPNKQYEITIESENGTDVLVEQTDNSGYIEILTIKYLNSLGLRAETMTISRYNIDIMSYDTPASNSYPVTITIRDITSEE